MLFPTTLVGSYPQPDWLIDREKLAGRFPPRVRAKELWRVAEPNCEMKYLSREVAKGKPRSMLAAAGLLRAEYAA